MFVGNYLLNEVVCLAPLKVLAWIIIYYIFVLFIFKMFACFILYDYNLDKQTVGQI